MFNMVVVVWTTWSHCSTSFIFFLFLWWYVFEHGEGCHRYYIISLFLSVNLCLLFHYFTRRLFFTFDRLKVVSMIFYGFRWYKSLCRFFFSNRIKHTFIFTFICCKRRWDDRKNSICEHLKHVLFSFQRIVYVHGQGNLMVSIWGLCNRKKTTTRLHSVHQYQCKHKLHGKRKTHPKMNEKMMPLDFSL